jgi:hypothetical protein
MTRSKGKLFQGQKNSDHQHRKKPGRSRVTKRYFLIRWEGYPTSEDSWDPRNLWTLAALPCFCLCACGRDGLAALCLYSHFQGKVSLCLQVKRLGKAMVDTEAAEAGPLEDAEDTSSSESEDQCSACTQPPQGLRRPTMTQEGNC